MVIFRSCFHSYLSRYHTQFFKKAFIEVYAGTKHESFALQAERRRCNPALSQSWVLSPRQDGLRSVLHRRDRAGTLLPFTLVLNAGVS